MVRLAHISDIHITAAPLDWKREDWFSKRLTSWLNFRYLGRERRFAHAEQVLGRLVDELSNREIDHIVFSGDATALGFESEIRRAAQLLRVSERSIPGLAVPGNHDYCTLAAETSGNFERYFAPWQGGHRIDDHRYPFAQRVGPVWLIGVNGATGNRFPWDAGGGVRADQRERLKRLLSNLEPGCKIMVMHFPVCLSSGKREFAHHGLRELDALLEVAHAGGVSLWLHGHRHTPYFFQRTADASFPVICVGSATQENIWSYGEYTITDHTLQAVRRTYDPSGHCFREAESFTLQLAAR